MPVLRDERQRRGDLEAREAAELPRRVADEIPEGAQDGSGVLQFVEHRPAVDVLDGAEPELEGGHGTEVAAASAQGPEEVVVLVLARDDHSAVRRHHIGGDQVVATETEPAGEISDATAEGEPADPRGGDDPAGRGQPEGVRRRVEVAPGRPALHARGAAFGVDAHTTHGREIGHDAAVAGTEAGHAVRAATYRESEVVLTGEVDRGHDVVGVGAAHDGDRSLVDHGVVDLACFVVGVVIRGDDRPAYTFAQWIDRGLAHGHRSSW